MKKTLLKKTAVLAVVLTLAVSVFAGCAGSPAATEPQTQPTTAATENTTKATEPTTNKQTTGDISLEQAKTIALEYVGISPSDTDIYRSELDKGVYEIEFIYDNFEHEVDISKTTGEVVRYEKDAVPNINNGAVSNNGGTTNNNSNTNNGGAANNSNTNNNSGANNGGNSNGNAVSSDITLDQAKAIAYAYVGVSEQDVTIYRTELDEGVYEIDFISGDIKYEVDVRRSTGEVVKYDRETIGGYNGGNSSSNGTSISADEALNIAYNHAGVSADAVTKREIDLDHNHYEIEFKADGYEYEYEVSLDGTVLKSEKDRDHF